MIQILFVFLSCIGILSQKSKNKNSYSNLNVQEINNPYASLFKISKQSIISNKNAASHNE